MSSVTIFGVLKSLSALMRMGYSSMSGSELEKIHSKRVEKIKKYTPNELRRSKTTLETGGELTVSMFQPGVAKISLLEAPSRSAFAYSIVLYIGHKDIQTYGRGTARRQNLHSKIHSF